MDRGGPTNSRAWLEIQIARAGGQLRTTSQSSHREPPLDHSLGPQHTLDTVHQLGEWVKETAAHSASLTPQRPDAQSLHAALFHDGLREVLSKPKEPAGAPPQPLLVRLMPQDGELQAIPWEALFQPDLGTPLPGSSRELCFVRGVDSKKPWQPREVRGAVRLLVVSPGDEAAPAQLRAALRPSIEAGELEWLEPLSGSRVSEGDLLQRLRSDPAPHILHFIVQGGRGQTSTPALRLADKDGHPSWLPVDTLAAELEPVFRNLRVIVLEARQGTQPGTLASAAELLAQSGADAVLAHLWPVQPELAQAFAVDFYRSLTGATPLSGDVACGLYDARRMALEHFHQSAEAFSPVLYLRGRDSTVFDFRRPKAALPSPPPRAATDAVPSGPASLELWLSVLEPAALDPERLSRALAEKYEAQAAPARQGRKFILSVQLPRPALSRLIQDAESGALDTLLSQAGGRFVQEIREGPRCLFSHIPPVTFAPPPSFEDVDSKDLQALLPQVDVVLLTTTRVERDALYEVLKPFPGRAGLIQGSLHNNTYRLGQFGRYVVAHVQSTMGSQARDGSTLTVSDALKELSPKAVVIIGIAFGIKPEKQRLGDVIIAETVIPYELQRVGQKVTHRGQQLQCGAILSERFRTRSEDWRLERGEDTVQIFQGPLLSGEKLADNLAFRDALAEAFSTAHGGEMEGAGAYAATERKGVEVILLKAICDWGDGTKTDRAQPFAARAAVSLAHHVLSKRAVLEPLKARDRALPDEARASQVSELWEAPHLRPLRNLLGEPFSLLLGDSLLGESWSTAVENFSQTLRDKLQKKSWATPEGLPISALAQRYVLQFGPGQLNTLFQEVFNDALPTLPLVDALAQRLQPGFHLTLMRLPILEHALARHRSEFPLYVVHPLQPGEDAPRIQQHVKNRGWKSLDELPEAFDPERDIVVLRLYRGYLANKQFDTPLLTEDDYLSSLGGLEDLLPEDLATELRSTLHERPALLLGMSLLTWDHRHVLQCLFGRGSLHPRSTVLLEPGNIEAEPWRKGRSLLRGTSAQVISAPSEELARLIALPTSGAHGE